MNPVDIAYILFSVLRLEQEASKTMVNADVANPIAAFHLVRRFRTLWLHFDSSLNLSHYEGDFNHLTVITFRWYNTRMIFVL
jgi:hypothetical protein